MSKLLKFLQLIRWENLAIICFTQYMARVFLVGKGDNIWESVLDVNQFLIALSTLCVAASGYIINDYFDVKIDLVNKPNEVVIGRHIKRRTAILWHQGLNLLGASLAYLVSLKVFVVNVIAISLLWVYASIFKKKPFVGNFMVAGLTGASLVVMAVFYTQNDLLINVYAVFAFGISLIREIVKDIEDIRGDMKYESKTLPIVWGLRKTKLFIFVILFFFSLAVTFMGLALGNRNLQIALGILGVPMAYIANKLYLADRKVHFSEISSMCKLTMLMGILSMIAV